jgi:hypothetical protein
MNKSPKTTSSEEFVNNILRKCFNKDKTEINWTALIVYTAICFITIAIWYNVIMLFV